MKRTLAAACVLGAGLTFGAAGSASANNATINLTVGGKVVAQATWDDLHDNFCVRSLVKGHTYTGTITLLDGSGPVWKVSHSGTTTTPKCTGNLSIPEDKRAFAIVGDGNHSTDGTFFT
ncbi:hypothetical protein [Luteipulveratus mongoliensis]|uniref:Uncharacterized protein n=1 Tax=Luteipulveratus mongoliensis TaxID=571913 RepID=A0A0K1JE60_9MICO|nr:hypothetical protein [Luteipulveratus mongoliensis]AKU14878.1 hypothetical protein VV02_01690 [Luteipulveratus mongoliensis]